MPEQIKVDGLAEFARAVAKIDKEAAKQLRLAGNEAVEVVLAWARPRVPRRSGRAVKSLKARSTRTVTRAQAGGDRAPYFPWLDFGGATGPNKSVQRPFFKEGRYLWKGLSENSAKVTDLLSQRLTATARAVGLDVD